MKVKELKKLLSQYSNDDLILTEEYDFRSNEEGYFLRDITTADFVPTKVLPDWQDHYSKSDLGLNAVRELGNYITKDDIKWINGQRRNYNDKLHRVAKCACKHCKGHREIEWSGKKILPILSFPSYGALKQALVI